jgi:hypothetical protein
MPTLVPSWLIFLTNMLILMQLLAVALVMHSSLYHTQKLVGKCFIWHCDHRICIRCMRKGSSEIYICMICNAPMHHHMKNMDVWLAAINCKQEIWKDRSERCITVFVFTRTLLILVVFVTWCSFVVIGSKNYKKMIHDRIIWLTRLESECIYLWIACIHHVASCSGS